MAVGPSRPSSLVLLDIAKINGYIVHKGKRLKNIHSRKDKGEHIKIVMTKAPIAQEIGEELTKAGWISVTSRPD